jgi:cardiolipin synthase
MAAPRAEKHRAHWPRHHRILAGILIVVILVGGGLLIAQDQETLRIRSPLSAEDARFPDYLSRLLGRPLTEGDSYIVHTNGDDAFPAMLDAIGRATRRVSFESYIYEKGDAGERFTAAFEAAARRGVRVRMVLDSIGSKGLGDDITDRLKAAGVAIGWVNPVLGSSIEEANSRTHRKALVIDGNVAFVGGMGIADQWLHDTKNFLRWRDTQIELHGPVVADVEAGFNQNWILTGGVVEPELRAEGPPPAGGGQSIVVWSAAQSGESGMKLLYLMALAAARHRVDIESPYLVTDESSKWSIHEARRRGVEVRLLVEGDKTDAKLVKYAGRADYDELLADGVQIAEYQPTMLHTKAMIVDDRLSIVGSANFDNRSLELNDELNVAAFDRALAARLRADFERDLTQSKRLTLDAWRARPVTDKARDWAWSYFDEVF